MSLTVMSRSAPLTPQICGSISGSEIRIQKLSRFQRNFNCNSSRLEKPFCYQALHYRKNINCGAATSCNLERNVKTYFDEAIIEKSFAVTTQANQQLVPVEHDKLRFGRLVANASQNKIRADSPRPLSTVMNLARTWIVSPSQGSKGQHRITRRPAGRITVVTCHVTESPDTWRFATRTSADRVPGLSDA
jgi:hypothetical protein